jgi:hypothetical protein
MTDTTGVPPIEVDGKYSVNAKALRRWAAERLALTAHPDGTTDASFRYEGSTCNDMGRPISFDYTVKVGRREDRYPILEQGCAPSPGDEGYTYMCRYRTASADLMASIADEKPLIGQPLDDVLGWQRTLNGPSCYCEGESRKYKWGLVLETLHFALAQRERQIASQQVGPQPPTESR